MMKRALALIPILLAPWAAQAADFSGATCRDLKGDPVRAAHVVGWLNLQNRDGTTERMDFEAADRDVKKLMATCAAAPDMLLHWAVTAFQQIDNEGTRTILLDPTPTARIPGKAAQLD